MLPSVCSLPKRQIHLDFHTSEQIPGVGSAFDPDEFGQTLSRAHVNSVTLFAKCHHGWSYYPTKIGRPHPQLTRPDLLGEMIEACRKQGIATPVYITVMWDELTARQHPEWRVIRGGGSGADPEGQPLTPTWHPLSLAHSDLVNRIITQALEVADRYAPEGLFFDIVSSFDDISQAAIERMQRRGLDPKNVEDRYANDRELLIEFSDRVSDAVRSAHPQMRVFFNGGHICHNERERYTSMTHLEVESLPTGGWGYDHFPLTARYACQFGKPIIGMTGKFHNCWGEFGGYKRPEALQYECAAMLAFGAGCSIGDQLHPNGRLDPATYELVKPAFAMVEMLERFIEGASSTAEIALFSAEGHLSRKRHQRMDRHNAGISRMLLESHLMFDVIDECVDFSSYRVILLPDVVDLEDASLRERFRAYLESGGKLVLTGRSGMDLGATRFLVPFSASVDGLAPSCPDYIEIGDSNEWDDRLPRSPFVVYSPSIAVRPDEESVQVWAGSRESFFNRSWDHFCSHMHTPYVDEISEERFSVLCDGSVLYFAHSLGLEYFEQGQPLAKYLFVSALKRLLVEPLAVEATLPSAARLTHMRQEALARDIVHLLYATPQQRGNEVALIGKPIQVIEDVTPLENVELSVASKAEPSRVFRASSGEAIAFNWKEGRTWLKIPRVFIHEAIVIED